MKVGLITRHFIPNYGSLLQTYATVKIIEKLGFDCEIINYIRKDEEAKNVSLGLLKLNKNWNSNFIKRNIFKVYQYFNYNLMYKKFSKKNNGYFGKISKRYCSIDELKNKLPKYDIYCSGSDQLWGPIGESEYDIAYFLEFAPKGSKCISYAGSFGTSIINENLNNNLEKLMKKYSNISVREKSAVDILESKKIKCNLVLDPTLLLSADEWKKYIEISDNTNENYILVYQLHNNKKFDQYVEKISKEKGLPIYILSTKLNNIIKKGKIIYLPSLKEFLYYINNANYIVTDSFHGTVFSIIFNKQFISITPGETSTRIENLLELFNLKSRYLFENYLNNIQLIDEKINWEKTNEILIKERNKSLKWLEKSLND